MIGVVLCSHNTLAEALLETTRMIVGDFPACEAVSVRPGDGPDDVLARLRSAITAVDDGSGVLILCDMFGGTPSNLSLSLLGESVEVVTGANLPMMLKLFTSRELPLTDAACSVRDHGRDNVVVAGALLRRRAS